MNNKKSMSKSLNNISRAYNKNIKIKKNYGKSNKNKKSEK